MSSYQITTARSAFKEECADRRYRCAGCGGAIPKDTPMLTKPYYRKGVIAGTTRIHPLQSCWEDYDESAINGLIVKRETNSLRHTL